MALIIYFSRADENLINGEIKVIQQGNTEKVAEEIANMTNLEVKQLIPLHEYPKNYDQTVKITEIEKKEKCYIPYHDIEVDLDKHREIFIGYPNWHGTLPRIVASFLQDHDFQQKEIFPFCTHEGSGLGNSVNEIKVLCPKANVYIGLPIRGSRVDKSERAVSNWLVQYRGSFLD